MRAQIHGAVCVGPHPDCSKAADSNKYTLAAERSRRPAPAVLRSRGRETKTLCGEWPFTPSNGSASVRNWPLLIHDLRLIGPIQKNKALYKTMNIKMQNNHEQ